MRLLGGFQAHSDVNIPLRGFIQLELNKLGSDFVQFNSVPPGGENLKPRLSS